MDKQKLIETEYAKISALYAGLPKNKRTLVEGLIQNAAFMFATLAELQEKINTEGAVIITTNGNGFEITQEHPAQKSYNTMIAKYSAVIGRLDEMLPAEQKESKLDAFLNG